MRDGGGRARRHAQHPQEHLGEGVGVVVGELARPVESELQEGQHAASGGEQSEARVKRLAKEVELLDSQIRRVGQGPSGDASADEGEGGSLPESVASTHTQFEEILRGRPGRGEHSLGRHRQGCRGGRPDRGQP